MRPTDTIGDERAMRFAYADPPYYGHAVQFYGDRHPDAGRYDTLDGHRDLVARLVAEFPDGWALSMTAPNLRHILPLCPEDCRVGAWVKPFASFKLNVKPAYAWEPVVFRGGRPAGRRGPTVRDWCSANITMKRGFPGAKPELLCHWLFELLNMRPGDEFVDLFPGSEAVSRAWESWKRQYHGLFGVLPGGGA